jgi:hypothetical protein
MLKRHTLCNRWRHTPAEILCVFHSSASGLAKN